MNIVFWNKLYGNNIRHAINQDCYFFENLKTMLNSNTYMVGAQADLIGRLGSYGS